MMQSTQQVGEKKYKVKRNFLFQINSKCIRIKFNVLNSFRSFKFVYWNEIFC